MRVPSSVTSALLMQGLLSALPHLPHTPPTTGPRPFPPGGPLWLLLLLLLLRGGAAAERGRTAREGPAACHGRARGRGLGGATKRIPILLAEIRGKEYDTTNRTTGIRQLSYF